MKRLRPLLAAFACAFVLHSGALGQGTRADYERAENLSARTRSTIDRTHVNANWFAGGDRFWYRNDLVGGHREFVLVHATEGERRLAFDHEKLAKALAAAAGKDVGASLLPIANLQFSDDVSSVRFSAFDKGWTCDLSTYEVTEGERPPQQERSRGDRGRRRDRGRGGERPPPGQKSPDGKWTAFVKDHNLYLRAEEGGEETALTKDGNEADGYRAWISWSSDSRKLVAIKRAKEQEHTVHRIESSPKDQVQPKLHSRQYLKPGDRIAISKPHLFDVEKRAEIPVSDELFANPWQMSDIRWRADSGRFTFFYNQRGHQVLRIIAVDAETGEVGAIIDEQSKTFLDYAGKRFSHYADRTHEIIWMSERDGWNHLYLYDSRTGDVKNQITRGEWVVRRVDHVDEENRQIWFRAGGVYPEQDPYYVHYCRVNFDGSDFTILTAGNGTHASAYSPDRRFLITSHSRVDQPQITELRRTDDGSLVCVLERTDWTALLETGWRAPERFVAKGRDGKTDIYGVIWRPMEFDPAKKYPVIEKIYAGPHSAHVPKSFRSYYRTQSLAELGFVVVQIDGMGTSHRSKAFHDVCWRNLRDAGFPDRILWMKAAAEKYPYMDVTRVGIYGGSAGGQNTMAALLFHGDFYKVGVADCGCHDNRMDKIWWNELWMGWPVGPWYEENSNVTHADKLTGKLFLTVGELDTNVDPASTMQVVNALIRAEKDFDFLMVPGAGHGIGDGSAYMVRRRRDYFVRHLHGVEPRIE